MPIAIEDPGDPRIAAFRDIRERDVVGRDGFIAEGRVVLKLLLKSERFRPTALLILRNRLAGLAEELAAVPSDAPVYVAERTVFDAIAGFPVHRGILAHGQRVGPAPRAEAIFREAAEARRPVVVAVGIANHDNMGAIFRNAAAFGAGGVVLDATSCHPLYRKALRVSVGAVLSVPFAIADDAVALPDLCRTSGLEPLALSPAGGLRLRDIGGRGPLALFLGAEGPGLPDALMGAMETVRIEMEEGFDSLNVATAGALVLQRLYDERRG